MVMYILPSSVKKAPAITINHIYFALLVLWLVRNFSNCEETTEFCFDGSEEGKNVQLLY